MDIEPNPALLKSYLDDANNAREDADRVLAVRALHAILLRWEGDRAEVCGRGLSYHIELLALQLLHKRWIKAGAPPGFDAMLRGFFTRVGIGIFLSPDPPAAMRAFWYAERKRGRRAEVDVRRNFDLAAAIQCRIDGGEKVTQAIKAVSKTPPREDLPHLSASDLTRIYYENRDAVIAARVLRASITKK